jgi:hypothetical protein
MQRWGKKLEENIKKSAMLAFIQSTGIIYGKGIEYRQNTNSLNGYLFIRREYVYLDNMRPHVVNVTSSRTRLLSWASRAINPEIRRGSRLVNSGKIKSFPLFVRPHPFIRRGIINSIQRLPLTLKRHVSISIEEI